MPRPAAWFACGRALRDAVELARPGLIGFALGAMYDSASWPDFAAALADVEQQASAQTLGARFQRFRAPAAYIAKRAFPHYFNAREGFPGVACADSDNPDTCDAW